MDLNIYLPEVRSQKKKVKMLGVLCSARGLLIIVLLLPHSSYTSSDSYNIKRLSSQVEWMDGVT